jgi:hypothetical protein
MPKLSVQSQLTGRPPWAFFALAALMAAGCDASSDYRAALRDQTKALEDLQAILARVSDQDSMREARAQLTRRFDGFDNIRARAQQLPPPTPEIMRQIQAEGEKVHQALQKVQEEVRRIRGLPEGPHFLESFEHMKGLLKDTAS